MPGGDLRDHITEHTSFEENVARRWLIFRLIVIFGWVSCVADVFRIIGQILGALGYLHDIVKVVHRGVNPLVIPVLMRHA